MHVHAAVCRPCYSCMECSVSWYHQSHACLPISSWKQQFAYSRFPSDFLVAILLRLLHCFPSSWLCLLLTQTSGGGAAAFAVHCSSSSSSSRLREVTINSGEVERRWRHASDAKLKQQQRLVDQRKNGQTDGWTTKEKLAGSDFLTTNTADSHTRACLVQLQSHSIHRGSVQTGQWLIRRGMVD